MFSGTGNISYEFESRGANVTSIDNNINTIKFLKKHGVCEKIDENGKYLINEIKNIISKGIHIDTFTGNCSFLPSSSKKKLK